MKVEKTIRTIIFMLGLGFGREVRIDPKVNLPGIPSFLFYKIRCSRELGLGGVNRLERIVLSQSEILGFLSCKVWIQLLLRESEFRSL